MARIGVVGRKGGSGKTTTAIHLAAELSARGRSVVVIDCDIQGSARHWAEPGNLPMPVRHMAIEHDDELPRWAAAVRNAQADFVVLDSPPHLNAAAGAIVGVADAVLVPCGPSGLDLVATGETVNLIREIRVARGGKLPRMMLVPNRVDVRTGTGRELRAALAAMGEAVGPDIRSRTAFSDAFNAGSWVGDYAPHSPAHAETRALADSVLAMLEGS